MAQAAQSLAGAIGPDGISDDQLAGLTALSAAVRDVDGAPSNAATDLSKLVDRLTPADDRTAFMSAFDDTFLVNPTLKPGWTYHDFGANNNPLFPADDPFKDETKAYAYGTQGRLNDCYLMAPLIEMAAVDPASLPNLITKDADGDYVVTLYGPQGQHSLKVDDELPVNSTSMFTGAWSSDPQQALWLGLVEKAVIEDSAIGDTFITGINDDSYAATDAGGFASQAMRTLTGVEHTFCNVASLSPDGDGIAQITSALNEHHLVIFNSHIQNAFGLLTGHSYATVGCDADGNFELVNPQGMNAGAQCPAIVKLSAAQLFSLAGLGNEAQNANEGFDIEAAAPNIGQQANLLVEAMAGSASQPSASTGSHLVQPPEMRTGGVLASSPLMAQPAG